MANNTQSGSNQLTLSQASNYFVPKVESQLKRSELVMTDYQKMCVTGAMQQIYQVIVDNDINPNSVISNVNNILLTVAALQLNANAQPREVYFQTRNVKSKQGQWHKEIEMGIEGDGNDALLGRFGRNVSYIHPFWQVREGDKFEYPKHMGIELTPPVWEPVGDAEKKVVRIVYPIDMFMSPDYGDGSERKVATEYFITEREQVKRNLLAHMSNNIMREKDKSARLEKIKAFAQEHTLDEMLDSTDMIALGKISPAWREPQSRETMIVRKMRNNIVKKIPKDFNNALVQLKYEESANESYQAMRRDVTEEANTEDFDKALEQHEQHEQQEQQEEAPTDASDNTVAEEAPVTNEPEPQNAPDTSQPEPPTDNDDGGETPKKAVAPF